MQIAAVAVSATDLSRAVAFYELLGFRFPPLEGDIKHGGNVNSYYDDPHKATGLDTALSELARHPYGSGLLLAIAVGFACFGAFCFLDARFRRT